MTTYQKMILNFGFIIGIMFCANAYLLFELTSLLRDVRANLASEIQSIDLAKRLQAFVYEEERSARKYLITRDQAYYDLFEKASDQFQETLDRLFKLQSGDQQTKLLANLNQKHELVLDSVAKTGDSPRRSRPVSDTADNRTRKENIESIDRSLERLIQLNQISIDGSIAALFARAKRSTRVAVAFTVFMVLLALIAAWMIARAITGPIRRVIQATQRIAQGFFEPVSVSSKDEVSLLAKAVNDMGEQLKKNEEFKADLMHQIVHELRQPLQVIYSAQGVLLEEALTKSDKGQIQMLQLMGANVEKVIKFANQFLDLAKIETARMEFYLAPTDLLPILTRAVADAKILASAKEISVRLSAASAPAVLADAERLSQVFSNLLSNAVKFTRPRGKVEITVSSSPERARVAVKDTGIGIAEEDLPKLFTKFYQAGNAAETRFEGSGLGLALVKAFVEAQGGGITVESIVGVGSTFVVELPLATKAGELAAMEEDHKPGLLYDSL
ncbi:MAG: HAMP domain-containing protein [Deltaproteobacteria bacterium]|nr:HAMP domain-containing protein [Deltaproteobacteria bacterium]